MPSRVRLFIAHDLQPSATLTLAGKPAHYLSTVMRLKSGDQFTGFNGRDGAWTLQIMESGRKAVTVQVCDQEKPQERLPDVWLCFAPIKKARIDWVVEKATELGVARIVPVLTQRTVVRHINHDRLHAHMVEAAEQCGRTALPELATLTPLDDLLGTWPAGRPLWFCDETLVDRTAAGPTKAANGAVLIGPEGGFSDGERHHIRSISAACAMRLGPRVLRADTAAVAAVTLWQSLCGDW